MSRAVVVVWLGATSLRAAHEPELASWGEARQVTVEDLAPDAPLPGLGHDDEVAQKIEALVAEASSVAEAGEAGTILKSAEALLRSHAELPESAWLMAEILRTRVTLHAASADEAETLERRANALEGTLASPYDPSARPEPGEKTTPPSAPTAAPPTALAVEALRFGAEGPLPTDDVYVDGVLGRRESVPVGEHHYRIVRGGGLAWSGWSDAPGLVRVRFPGTSPCSATDLGAIDDSSGHIILGHRVLCPEWAVARPTGDGRIEVARCHGSSCGRFLPWEREWGRTFEGPAHPHWPAPKNNSWIFWTATSVVVAAVAGVAVWQSGVFEKEPETRVLYSISPPGGPGAKP